MEEKEEAFDINSGKAIAFEDSEGRFTLSPRGCFMFALIDTGIIEDDDPLKINEDSKFDMAFNVLVKKYKERGFIETDEEIPIGSKEDEICIFKKVIGTYYKDATDSEIEIALDEFTILLQKHGNTVKK